MAQSLPFALELLRTLAGDKAVEKVAEGIQL
jgi:4-methyl-5(b-hydroxyethyl)-thiazole monophosphate biosynthesis